MKDSIVAFHDSNQNEEIYGPGYFQMGEMEVKNDEDLKVLTYELLKAKLPMLQNEGPYARNDEEKSWLVYALGYTLRLKRNRKARLAR
ncbi:hypothetical protein FHL15_007112 [Xylaria flabelliformis]|uniref:Uncharacterized protein n=1 Tax=Xylaria flabelliformis TaxID=2512241 RepID=A0A553HVP0_9PEZI|nr:hypothetical protein FHL15_007112 [Xylaria flabelliformis]